jgi:hypothetical protein
VGSSPTARAKKMVAADTACSSIHTRNNNMERLLRLYVIESYNELVNKVTWPTWANPSEQHDRSVGCFNYFGAYYFCHGYGIIFPRLTYGYYLQPLIYNIPLRWLRKMEINYLMRKISLTSFFRKKPEEERQWYSLRVISGKERKIKERIELEIDRSSMG